MGWEFGQSWLFGYWQGFCLGGGWGCCCCWTVWWSGGCGVGCGVGWWVFGSNDILVVPLTWICLYSGLKQDLWFIDCAHICGWNQWHFSPSLQPRSP